MNTLLSSFEFKMNKSGTTNAEKYPLLVGSVFTMNLVDEDSNLFTAEVSFNFAIDSLCIKIYKGNTVIQGDTIVNSYPTNLLLCKELNDYGLIYDEIDSIFKFYKLDGWYNNSTINYYERIEMFKNREM